MAPTQLHMCPLCGYRFDVADMACHTACPLGKDCNLLCCPNCGYQAPDEDRMWITGTLKRVWEARKQARQAREV